MARRLGGRKPGALLGGIALADHVAAAASRAGLRPLLVVKPDTPLEGIETEALIEPEQPRHPLVGIATALSQLGEPVVCCACDLPLVPAGLLAALASSRDEICVAAHDGQLQPLLGRYEPAAGPRLLAAAAAGHPVTETVLAAGATELDPVALGLGIDPSIALANANDEAELARLESYMAGRPAASGSLPADE